jgi:hypothetical protein
MDTRLFQFLQTVETKTCSTQRLENMEDKIGNFRIKCRLIFINNYKVFPILANYGNYDTDALFYGLKTRKTKLKQAIGMEN